MTSDTKCGWSQCELELLGSVAEHIGCDVVGEQGVTQHGDPWFVLERPDGSAVAHFAKVEGRYICAQSVAGFFDTGCDLSPLVMRFIEGNKKPA